MKSLQIAVVLLVLYVGTLEALRCNRCIPSSVGRSCYKTVETCSRSDEVCASVISTGPVFSHFKRCMKASDAFILNSLPNVQVFTCTTDLCN